MTETRTQTEDHWDLTTWLQASILLSQKAQELHAQKEYRKAAECLRESVRAQLRALRFSRADAYLSWSPILEVDSAEKALRLQEA